jgi:signal transduction histidine kinase
MIRLLTIRGFYLLLLLQIAIETTAMGDSTLWGGIKEANAFYQQGQRDSTLIRASQLLTKAETLNDALAQALLCNLIGFCLREQGDEQGAIGYFARCVEIGENKQFLLKADKASHNYYPTAMLPAYSLLSTYYKDHGQIAKGAAYARNGIRWMPYCDKAGLRVSAMSSLAEVLMKHEDYNLVYEPMKQVTADALRLNMPDFALQIMAYLIIIERNLFHRSLKDIPWVKAGEPLLDIAKTETAKTAFLAEKVSIAQTDSLQTRIKYVRVRNERIGIIGGILAVVVVVFILYILWQGHQHRKKAKITERQMDERYLKGQEEERSRLAKELHDGVSNQLLAIEMKLHEDGLTPQTMQLLSESREQVRRVSHELIPPEFEDATLDEVIQGYAKEVDGLQQCEVHYVSSPADTDWSLINPTMALEIYRIVQEATTNAFKHSGASTISIGMHLNDQGYLSVTINDNGTPSSDRVASTGIGTRTINQRAAAIGGKADFYQHRFGSTVKLTVILTEYAK